MWEVRCSGCGMFHMCYVWTWKVWGCLLFGVWDVQDVEFLGYAMIGMCDVWDMGWDVENVVNLRCEMLWI